MNPCVKQEEFFRDPLHKPISYAVSHWSEDPFIGGAWSQLTVGGSPEDRRMLGSRVSSTLILAGEACHEVYPAMVHGAALSGIRASREICQDLLEEEEQNSSSIQHLPVIVIGAGAAGVFAAATLQGEDVGDEMSLGLQETKNLSRKLHRKVIVLEAKERVGGRVNTITLQGCNESGANCLESMGEGSMDDIVKVDLGASWLQQFPDNFLVDLSKKMKLDLYPTNFNDALCAACDGPINNLGSIVEMLYKVVFAEVSKAEANDQRFTDMSILDAVKDYVTSLPLTEKRLANYALFGDIFSDLGYSLGDTSAKHALEELGIGNDDHFIKQGYSALLDKFAEKLDIHFETPVSIVNWSQDGVVQITTLSGQIFQASRCICTVPVSSLQCGKLKFVPELPQPHKTALSRIRLAKCEKVVLRYLKRWWPTSPNGLCRWYAPVEENITFPLTLLWNEFIDISDAVGAPVVVGFCVGSNALDESYKDRDDRVIVEMAAKAFESWAWHYMHQS